LRKDGALSLGARAIGTSGRRNEVGIDVGQRILRKVANGHRRLRIGLLQFTNDTGRDLVGVGHVAARTAADLENSGHGFTPMLGFGLLGASHGIDDAEIANPSWADAAWQRMDDAHRQRSDHGRARNDRTCHQAKPLSGPDKRYLLGN